jgi:hypothetical protein
MHYPEPAPAEKSNWGLPMLTSATAFIREKRERSSQANPSRLKIRISQQRRVVNGWVSGGDELRRL